MEKFSLKQALKEMAPVLLPIIAVTPIVCYLGSIISEKYPFMNTVAAGIVFGIAAMAGKEFRKKPKDTSIPSEDEQEFD